MAKTADKASGAILAFEDGAFVFQEGDESRELYVVQEGEVELLLAQGALVRLGPGEPFGELACLEQAPRECSARAAGPCRVLKIDPPIFALLLKEPSVVAPILRRLSRRSFAALSTPVLKVTAAPVELRRPRFVHAATGMEFPVPVSGEAVVGRADPKSGFKPEIELSGADPKRSLSRKHARVSIREGAVFVSEESRVSNGTFVNGARLKAGASVKLVAEDQVRFGLVETVFKLD